MLALFKGKRSEPSPGAKGVCPGCGNSVIAKCGEIVTWHWSHVVGADCDPWYEPESAWHSGWKNLVPEDQREIVMPPHRADIVTRSGLVIELQHAYLSPNEVREREDFYGDMVWIIDASNMTVDFRMSTPWNHSSDRETYPGAFLVDVVNRIQWILYINRPMFWDFGNGWLLRVDPTPPGRPRGMLAFRSEADATTCGDHRVFRRSFGPWVRPVDLEDTNP